MLEKCMKNKTIRDFLNNYDQNKPDTMSGHSKNITSLILLNENKLVSGSEDKTIKICDIQKRLCISTITGNYERIESLLKIKDNIIAAGSQNTIRLLNKEISFLILCAKISNPLEINTVRSICM